MAFLNSGPLNVSAFTAGRDAFVVERLAWTGPYRRFAEPADGGNIDVARTTLVGNTVTIVPRGHASEALGGQQRWRNFLFAMRDVAGRRPTFALPLTSPQTHVAMHSPDRVSFAHVKPVWSYDRRTWREFDHYDRSGFSSATRKITFRNNTPFTSEVVWVAINEQYPVEDYYAWLRGEVFSHRLVQPTASADGAFVIGMQAGGRSDLAFSRSVPATPLHAFQIRDPAARPTKVALLVSGQHPYEGQNKWVLQGAVQFLLSDEPAAVALRRQYVFLVYPHVNPTGELAGLWRGTAANIYADVNRNWMSNKLELDTVTIHRRAMLEDVAALGLGAPAALFDFHQTFENVTGHVIRSDDVRSGVTAGFYRKLLAYSPRTGDQAVRNAGETLRAWSNVVLGTSCTITCERSVYSSAGEELAYGKAVMYALLDYSRAGAFD